MNLTERDLTRLKGVRAELIDVASLSAKRIQEETGCQMIITEGVRTKERQAQLVKAGLSKTMNSNHITGRAFDFALMLGDEVRWDWPLYVKAGGIIKQCARNLGVRIVWGGDWRTLRDGPHVELAKDWP